MKGLEAKTWETAALLLVLLSTVSVSTVPMIRASGTIYLRADGSIDPSTAPIQRDGSLYTFTDDISDSIVVERNNIVIDGAGYTVQGNQRETYAGLSLKGISNVTIKKINIEEFQIGILLDSSNNNTLSENILTDNDHGIKLSSSNNNTVSGNSATENGGTGILLVSSGINTVIGNNATSNGNDGIYVGSSSNNIVSGNTAAGNGRTGINLVLSSNNMFIRNAVAAGTSDGIGLSEESSDNTFIENSVTDNTRWGIFLVSSSNNTIYHNNFIDNGVQAYVQESLGNVWSGGIYPSGNYWSDYDGADNNRDWIGDTSYVIDSDNQDAYPLMVPWSAPSELIKRPYELFIATGEDGTPDTVDPAWANDPASEELISNVYDTLVAFDGDHMDRYLPALATEWTDEELEGIKSPEGLSWYYRHTYKIRQGVTFQNSTFGNLTTEDIEYSFERALVQDRDGGPTWMFYEPLLNTRDAYGLEKYGINMNSPEGIVAAGKMIDHAVESNATHVWFNLAFPGAYAPFMQILCQPHSSILSTKWMQDYVVGTLGRTSEWNGEWDDYTDWIDYHDPDVSPLDDPSPVMMGTGPFVLETLNYTAKYWSAARFADYWRGWPLDFPAFEPGSRPAGYVNTVKCTWAYVWPVRVAMFLNQEVDICTVPRQYIGEILNRDSIRCTYPLFSLAVDACFYQFDINTTSLYGPIFDYGVIGETGIPRDFFGSADYGKYIRQAFSHCIDFDNYILTVFLGEATRPATCVIPTPPYYDDSTKYTFDLAAAEALFKKWLGLWETGFTLNLIYNTNIAKQTLFESIASNVNSLNPKFHVQAVGLDWASYLAAYRAGQLPVFVASWQADYPDQHNSAYSFYHTYGSFAARQGYSNPQMDTLIIQGISTPDGRERANIYGDIRRLAIDDCPCVALASPIDRHFEQTWVCGWYYNPVYHGVYAANLWKWYYTPHAQQAWIGPTSTGNLLPYDANYDGQTDLKDIAITAASFGGIYGPPMSTKWVYRCDFNNDRKIDMKDIGGVAKNFFKKSAVWIPY